MLTSSVLIKYPKWFRQHASKQIPETCSGHLYRGQLKQLNSSQTRDSRDDFTDVRSDLNLCFGFLTFADRQEEVWISRMKLELVDGVSVTDVVLDVKTKSQYTFTKLNSPNFLQRLH